ncbi:hypothetical protein BS50DRAFT_317609 [Corynespora cassiicola Philippines]|uniref:Uncharacterized protein n=1 Tax=Corynespora cassiicola Philippines TaxID=1448308 RepID=A0A2T2N0E9_CORCC|nr:hypothetical protein BS50DRAFT_317609 [Corynespora cassiicola Philippines]
MYNRALRRYQEAIKPEHLPTYLPALNTMWGLAALFDRQHQIEDAKLWYSKTLTGYENVKGKDHSTCETLRNNLAALERAQDEVGLLSEELPLQEGGNTGSPASINTGPDKSVSKRHRLLRRIGWKRQ